MSPVTSGTAIQPAFSPRSQQPVAGMAVLTGTDHWKLERAVVLAMFAIIPGSFIYDSAFMNYLLAATLAIHAHWGSFEEISSFNSRYVLYLKEWTQF